MLSVDGIQDVILLIADTCFLQTLSTLFLKSYLIKSILESIAHADITAIMDFISLFITKTGL
jgi:hypothetical protein